MGNQNTVLADRGSAVGYMNTVAATADDASAFGHTNTASGNESAAFGFNNVASAENASAMGHINTANAERSSALGIGNNTRGIGLKVDHFCYFKRASTLIKNHYGENLIKINSSQKLTGNHTHKNRGNI